MTTQIHTLQVTDEKSLQVAFTDRCMLKRELHNGNVVNFSTTFQWFKASETITIEDFQNELEKVGWYGPEGACVLRAIPSSDPIEENMVNSLIKSVKNSEEAKA